MTSPSRLVFHFDSAPPTVNHCWGRTRSGRTYLTAEYKAFKELVKSAVKGAHIPESWKYCAVTIAVRPKSRRRQDVDNRIKTVLDALTAAGVWTDDDKVARVTVEFREPDRRKFPNGGALVTITKEEVKYK